MLALLRSTMDFTIPNGLFDLLKNVTIAVLRERPLDLYEFVADYFVKVTVCLSGL